MKKTIVLTLLLALAVSSVVVAQNPGRQGQRGFADWPGDGPRMEGHRGFRGHDKGFGQDQKMPGIQRILAHGDEINLTDQQREKLEKMAVDFKLAAVDQKAKLEKAQINLHAFMRDDGVAESTVMAAIDEVSDLKAEMQKMRYRHFQQAKSVLTAEQIDQLKDMRREFRRGQAGRRKG